ncbi:MAG: hypothetical protein ACRDO8_02145 [Nocardioidaceae bacterium]
MAESPRAREQRESRRRRRAALLLGEVLPSVTDDETAVGWGERGTSSRDDEMRADVPPHHGG